MKWIATLFMVLAFAARAAAGGNPWQNAAGLFYLGNSCTGTCTDPPSPFPANVAGYTYRVHWNQIEPSCNAAAGQNPTNPNDPCYSWTAFDALLSSLPSNIKIAIGIVGGVQTPNWALKNYEGDTTGTMSSVWNKTFGGVTQNTPLWGSRSVVEGEVYEFPVPWDPNYEQDIINLAQALATHLAGASYAAQVVRIKGLDVMMSNDEENFLMQNTFPYTVGTGSCAGSTICNGPCAGMHHNDSCTPTQKDDRGTTGCNTSGTGLCGTAGNVSWQTLGYTPARAEAAYDTMIAGYINAFPHMIISGDFVQSLNPRINNAGQINVAYTYPTGCTVASNASSDGCLTYSLIQDAIAAGAYTTPQENGGTNAPASFAKFYLGYTHARGIGGQTVAALQNDANYATMLNEYIGCAGANPNACWRLNYFETYDADATDPGNTLTQAWANSAAINAQYPTGSRE